MKNANVKLKVVESGDFAGEVKPVIHQLSNSRELFDVYRLTYECYQAHGYALPRLDGLWIPHPDFDHITETAILIAELDNEIVGSVSITLDGTHGLPLDRTFQRTCMLTRIQARRMAQVWRLIVKDSCPLKEAIAKSLVDEALKHLVSRGVQTTLLFVSEEHAPLCRELSNAVILTRTWSAHGLSNAASVLMRVETEDVKGLHEQTEHPRRR